MNKEVIFICRKCNHHLFLSDPNLESLDKIANLDCPSCGEEGYENWVLSHIGNSEKEKDNYDWI